MEKLLKTIDLFPSWKQSLRNSCKRNNIKTSYANTITPLKIKNLHDRLLKTYQTNKNKAKTCWFENQLRAYYWVLLAVSEIRQIKICQFGNQQWQYLSQIFKYKERYVLEYQAIRLNPGKQLINNSWNQQQEQILKDIINHGEKLTNKWNDIARTLFKQSNTKYYRSGKQCRERWLNHLDPKKIHGSWTFQEDTIIVSFILKDGKKWSEIAKNLGDLRTEHMVKNRFKSLLIKQKKKYPSITNQHQLLQTVINITKSNEQFPSQIQQQEQEILQSSQEYSKEERQTSPKPKENLKLNQQNSKIDQKQVSPICNFVNFDEMDKQALMIKDEDNDNDEKSLKKCQMKNISPYVGAFTPQQQGLTPTISILMSPSPAMPFFMNSFTQGCMNFHYQWKLCQKNNQQ